MTSRQSIRDGSEEIEELDHFAEGKLKKYNMISYTC